MTKRQKKRPSILVILAVFLFVLGGALSADPPPGEGAEWLAEIESLARMDQSSVNVETVEFAVDSFFDVFVNVVLREGLPEGAQDDLGTALSSDEVTAIIQSRGPELRRDLQLVMPDGTAIPVAPGAAVFKWDAEGRWCRGPHIFDIYNWVMVNQWIRASMNSTKLVWKVFKPGEYSTDCMYLNVHSNGAMELTLANYGPLVSDTTTTAVATEYALSEYINTEKDLVLAGRDMLDATPVINWVPDGATGGTNVGPHALVKVWNYINVSSYAPPGLYTTPNGPSAVITVAPTL
jgi:hypothetical protein